MKFTSFIDNVNSKSWGLTILQAYLFDWVYTLPSWAEKVIIGDIIFYFASRTKVIDDLPLLTDKADTVYRYYKQLEEMGLITLVKVGRRDYISLTEKAKVWGRKLGFESEYSENNPSKPGFESELKSDLNPTYKNTILDKNISIDTRKQNFIDSMTVFKSKYKAETLNAFYNYWTETNDDNTMMRFEKEKFFEISKRLSTWFRNEKQRAGFGPQITTTQAAATSPSPFNNLERFNREPE